MLRLYIAIYLLYVCVCVCVCVCQVVLCMCTADACGYAYPAACKRPRLMVPGLVVLAFLAIRLVSQPLFAGAAFQQLV